MGGGWGLVRQKTRILQGDVRSVGCKISIQAHDFGIFAMTGVANGSPLWLKLTPHYILVIITCLAS